LTLVTGETHGWETTKKYTMTFWPTLGPIAVPLEIEFVDKLPKTRNGKIMRRVLKVKELGIDPGDISTLEE
jgi:acetyl-CoA synthetase